MPLSPFHKLTLAALLALSAAPAFSQGAEDMGAYLAGRAAALDRDFGQAALFFGQAVAADPDNMLLQENALAALLGVGNVSGAIPVADQIVRLGFSSQFAHMTRAAAAAADGDWDKLLANLDQGQAIGPLVDGLARGWADVGRGQMAEAIAAFDAVIASPGLKSFGLYHKALALAVVGDYEGADAILSLPPTEGMQHTRQSSLAHAQVLSQLGRNADAVAMLDETFGPGMDPSLLDLRNRLVAAEMVPFTYVTDAQTGLAEVFFSVAMALGAETSDSYILIYGRIAQYLNPGKTEVNLLLADLLEGMQRYDLAIATYDLILRDDPAYLAAELGRSAVMRRDGQAETAVEVLQQLAESHPGQAVVQATLGDTLRGLRRYEEANAAYGRALEMYRPDDSARWFVLYARGITFYNMDQWPAAEADLRAALELNPEQAQVLNYLGYSLVEEGRNLDEALGMIEKAVRMQPDNGAIVDSLGWVLFRLGQYPEAVIQLERAAALEPVDPVVNDHLGDVYWAVGRLNEAQFQWNRALSLNPEEAEAVRIRAKLDIGLDAVLASEGASPLHLSADASP